MCIVTRKAATKRNRMEGEKETYQNANYAIAPAFEWRDACGKKQKSVFLWGAPPSVLRPHSPLLCWLAKWKVEWIESKTLAEQNFFHYTTHQLFIPLFLFLFFPCFFRWAAQKEMLKALKAFCALWRSEKGKRGILVCKGSKIWDSRGPELCNDYKVAKVT